MLAWDGLLGVAVILWLLLRVSYRRSLFLWKMSVDAAAEERASDVWALSRRSEWEARKRLLEAHREGYADQSFLCMKFVQTLTWLIQSSGWGIL